MFHRVGFLVLISERHLLSLNKRFRFSNEKRGIKNQAAFTAVGVDNSVIYSPWMAFEVGFRGE